MPVYDSRNVADTEAVAAGFARSLAPGACVALHGDLGAGKTQFVRGVVTALGGDGRAVSSPTYVLLHAYDTPAMRVYHLDAYRVSGADDFEQIGFVELLDQGGVVIVEWASRVADLLPADCRMVRIESIGESERRIAIDDARHPPPDLPPVPSPGTPGEG